MGVTVPAIVRSRRLGKMGGCRGVLGVPESRKSCRPARFTDNDVRVWGHAMKRSPSTPPSIAELTAGFLNRPADAEALAAAADAIGEVEPHEVSVGFRAEPGLAWRG